jgi:hypothetical protein
MKTTTAIPQVNVNSVVRHRAWSPRQLGTVVRRKGDIVYVAWHNTCVEDELNIADLQVVSNASPRQKAWRGGVGIVTSNGRPYTLDSRALTP